MRIMYHLMSCRQPDWWCMLIKADVLWICSIRLAAANIFLLLYGLISGAVRELFHSFRPGRVWFTSIPASVIGVYLSTLLWIIGIKYTYTTVACILNQSSVIFVIILAALFLKEPLTPPARPLPSALASPAASSQ